MQDQPIDSDYTPATEHLAFVESPFATSNPPNGPNHTNRILAPRIVPYDGSSDFSAFIKKFEIIVDCCQWNERTWLLQLLGLLTGKVLECYAAQEL